MNDTYYFALKTSSSSGHHHGGKGKHTRGQQKHHAQHQLKGDISKIEDAIDIHPKNLGKDVAEHTKERKTREHAHHNILSRNATKGKHRHHDKTFPVDPIFKGKEHLTKAQHKAIEDDKKTPDPTGTEVNNFNHPGDSGSDFAYAYSTATATDNNHLLLVLGITGLTVLALSLNKFI